MPVDAGLIGAATLVLSQGSSNFLNFLPKLTEVRRASIDKDPDIANDVRVGEVAALALTVGMGAMVSSLTGSTVPILVGLCTAGFIIGVYEMTLRSNPYLHEGSSDGSIA